jgi:hypothetical protein
VSTIKAFPGTAALERVAEALLEIREAAAGMGDRGHDIYCWAAEALEALGYMAKTKL